MKRKARFALFMLVLALSIPVRVGAAWAERPGGSYAWQDGQGKGYVNVGDKIKEARLSSHLSQTEFAESAGVSFTVNRWENAKAVPNYQMMKRLIAFCKATNIDVPNVEGLWKEDRNAWFL